VSTPQQLSAFNNLVLPRSTIKTISSGSQYTVTAADYGVILNFTGTTAFTVNIAAPAASLGVGFYFDVWCSTTGVGSVTIDPYGSEYFANNSLFTLYTLNGGSCRITSDGSGTNWKINNFSPFGTGITIGSATSASSNGTAIGINGSGQGSIVTGSGSISLNGSYASGAESIAAAIADNSTTYGAKGLRSIAMGYHAIAGGQSSVALSTLAQASQIYSVAIGYGSQATNTSSVSIGGGTASGGASVTIGAGWTQPSPIASANSAVAMGDGSTASAVGAYAFGTSAKADIIGKFSYSSNYFAAQGDAQTGKYVLRAATTTNTPVILTTDGAAASTTNQLVVSDNSAYTFTIIVVARQQVTGGGSASASWKIEGLIRREATAATTTLVNYITTVISNVPGWTLAVSADTTNGALAITATGALTTNIRWVATAMTSEVTYA
jgi:hypothetical protein